MTWTTASGSMRGAHHEQTGAPNEDHARVTHDPVVVTVADGHGAPRYTRADRGSRLATAAALDVLRGAPGGGPTDLDGLPKALVTRWHELVADDLDADPPGSDEPQDEPPYHLYGTTLLAAAVVDDGLLLVQLGDGDIVLGHRGSDRADLPIRPREYALANATDSMIQDDAADNVRVAVVHDLPDVVLLATDGLEAATRRAGWRDRVAVELLDELEGRSPDSLDDLLAERCSHAAREGGDDTTMALLVGPDLLTA